MGKRQRSRECIIHAYAGRIKSNWEGQGSSKCLVAEFSSSQELRPAESQIESPTIIGLVVLPSGTILNAWRSSQ